jgi:hypothetical protein
MFQFKTVRLITLSAAVVASVAFVSPASAAGTTTIPFTLYTDQDNTILVPCPQGTPPHVVMCGYVKDVPMDASNTAGDPGLTGTVTESFASALEAPVPTAECNEPGKGIMIPHTVGTIRTSRGDIFWVTSGGKFNMCTGYDIEPFTIVGGTGTYKGATGSGTVHAQQTGPTSATETFTGTLILGR